jgi:hypothetical protein
VWLAFNAGSESWKTYLETAKGRFTAEAFVNLSNVEASDRAKPALEEAPLLSLVPKLDEAQTEAELSRKLRTLEADLSRMSRTQLVERANRLLEAMVSDDDPAA